MLHPSIYQVSEVCHKLGIHHVVLSPGSRNAPLTISFARNEKMKKWIIPDERAAGFIALGIAQEINEPVVLCCTSGTAMLNYAPAVAEAFYREIPLVVMSADRPMELIDQRDGQTIRQFGALKNLIKNSYQLPIATDHTQGEFLNKLVEGIIHSSELPKGPIHLNIPFKEPFYPTDNQRLEFNNIDINIPHSVPVESEILPKADGFKKVLVLVGQCAPNDSLSDQLNQWSDYLPVLVSPLNNLTVDGIRHTDLFIEQQSELKPDLLITSGLSVLSKKLKNFLRKCQPDEHWHFDPAGVYVDTYQTKPTVFKADLSVFLNSFDPGNPDSDFLPSWRSADRDAGNRLKRVLEVAEFSELKVMQVLLDAVPPSSNLHLGNSMPVRYADILGVRRGVATYSNRGTSGIDGVTSTALGTSLVSDKVNTLITGDLSFLYDRNAFFHNHTYPNLKIVVINNQGGGIFRLIDGPSRQPELEEYFETRHQRTAEYIALENGITYLRAKNEAELEQALKDFYSSSQAAILEVFTDPVINQNEYRKLRDTKTSK